MDYKGRLQRVRESAVRHEIAALLVTHLPNIRYLCGFTGSAGILLLNSRNALFFTDGRYKEQAREEVQGARVLIASKAPLAAVADWLTRVRGGSNLVIGIEAEHMSVAARNRLAKTLGKNFRLKEAPPLVERARLVKDAAELTLIRNAVNLGASLFDIVKSRIRPGITESEIAAEMEHAARRSGADAMSFETIIAGGKRSALPHGRASNSPIPKRGFVVCDFGVILKGYCSDMTRTLYMGRPSGEARGFYQAVLDAQQAAAEAVASGVTVGQVDQSARKVLKKAGLGSYFTHSTGHGVGLEIHEAPRVAAGQPDVLQPGMVITIEPGAYLPGKWGVRIEDMVVVTEKGCEVLTPTSKELTTI